MTTSESEKHVRIADIAEKLHMSTATVSNVLHGKTKKISMETVEVVTRALEDAEYMPQSARVLMAQNNSRMIAVIINDHEKYEGRPLVDPFISGCVNSLCRECEASGFLMIVRLIAQSEIQQLSDFASMWNLEGLILIGFCEQDYQRLRARITVPVVILTVTLLIKVHSQSTGCQISL